MYLLLDKMDLWYYSENEIQCKEFIQVQLGEINVSVGDFTKAVLKIVAIIHEIIMVCEKMNQSY